MLKFSCKVKFKRVLYWFITKELSYVLVIRFETLKCFNNALKLELILKFQLNRLVNKNMFVVLGSAFEPGTSQKGN